MATSKSLSQVRTLVRGSGEYRDPFFTDTLLNLWINQSVAKLYRRLVAIDDDRFIKRSSDIAVSSGTEIYDLPSDCWIVKGVEIKDSDMNTGYLTLLRYNPSEANEFADCTDKYATQWDVANYDDLFLHPIPNWSGYVRVIYVPTAPQFDTADDDSTVDFINYWDEWVVLDVAIKATLREEGETERYRILRDEKRSIEREWKRFRQIMAGPKTIHNVRYPTRSQLRKLRYNNS